MTNLRLSHMGMDVWNCSSYLTEFCGKGSWTGNVPSEVKEKLYLSSSSKFGCSNNRDSFKPLTGSQLSPVRKLDKFNFSDKIETQPIITNDIYTKTEPK